MAGVRRLMPVDGSFYSNQNKYATRRHGVKRNGQEGREGSGDEKQKEKLRGKVGEGWREGRASKEKKGKGGKEE